MTHADRPHAISSALRAAIPPTLPILAGFVFLGITCGVYSVSLGLPWWTPTLMACLIFAGSAEFVVASMLVGPFAPLQAFVTVFIVNARHLFYGLSMLERFRGLGRKRPYLIFAQCDETFSINYSTRPPAGVDEGWFMFFVSLLNQLYWVVGCTLGGVLGSVVLGVAATAIYQAVSGRFVSLTVEVNVKHYLLIAMLGVFASILGILGDLFASAIKRQVGLKDYGTIFPGHGGILDRFDSVMFVAPFVAFIVRYFFYFLR